MRDNHEDGILNEGEAREFQYDGEHDVSEVDSVAAQLAGEDAPVDDTLSDDERSAIEAVRAAPKAADAPGRRNPRLIQRDIQQPQPIQRMRCRLFDCACERSVRTRMPKQRQARDHRHESDNGESILKRCLGT